MNAIGERIRVRCLLENDRTLFHELYSDIEVTRYIGGPFSDIQISERFQRELNNQLLYGVQYWPVFRNDTDAFIGCAGLRPIEGEGDMLEIGIHLCTTAWGHRFGHEILTTIINYAFNTLRIKRIFAGHNPNNSRSKVLLQSLGFEYSYDRYYEPTGLMHPSYILINKCVDVDNNSVK